MHHGFWLVQKFTQKSSEITASYDPVPTCWFYKIVLQQHYFNFTMITFWEVPSGSESTELLVRQTENSTSGWGSIWKRSSVGSRFSKSLFQDVPGTVPESDRTSGFKRNSSDLGRAPRMRDSVLLNSWDSFLVTLPLISSETSVIYSSVIPGTDLFLYWLFLGCYCVSLEMSANFRLFPNVAISWGKTIRQ